MPPLFCFFLFVLLFSPESFSFYSMNFGRGFMDPSMFLDLIASSQKYS
jgi:hypothetical protein